MNVSALILTLNEEANLPRCLSALSWCDDIVIVDSFSSDGTLKVATELGARVVQRVFSNFADQRNFALENVAFRHDWVLHLDADEVVTPELREEIAALDEHAGPDAYRIASRLMLEDKWLRYSGMYPVYQVRLSRRPQFRFREVGHGQQEASSAYRIGTLSSDYLHYAFSKGLDDWLLRHIRYSTAEAEYVRNEVQGRTVADLFSRDRTVRRRALKRLSYTLPFRPFFRFVYMYLLCRGFLDGLAGYRYSQMMAMYERLIDLKLDDLSARRLS